MDSTVIGLCLFNEWQLIHISTCKSSIERLCFRFNCPPGERFSQRTKPDKRLKEKTYLFLSGCHAIASGNNSFSFPKNISLYQSSKSANIEWNLSQTVDDMGLKLANFLRKLQLVWDPFWIVFSLHHTSCITPLTKLSFADILSTAWWIKQSSWLHVNSFLFELDSQYDYRWIWEI